MVTKNENRPPNGSIIKEEIIRRQSIWEDGNLVKSQKILLAVYNYSVDKKDYQNYKK